MGYMEQWEIKLEHVGWFQAPSRPIRPTRIRKGHQYVELITGGQVLFEINGRDKVCGPGSLFWHIPGEDTVYRSILDDPYNCLTVTFSTNSLVRGIPRYSFWSDQGAVQTFKETALKTFHDNRYKSGFFSDYIYATLRWVAFSSRKR